MKNSLKQKLYNQVYLKHIIIIIITFLRKKNIKTKIMNYNIERTN